MKIKAIVYIMAVLGFSSVYANDVYVEQVGDSSTINITQQGTGNKIGDLTNPAFIGGGSNTVTIDQIGSNNILAMVVNGASTSVSLSVLGGANEQTITCGTAISPSCSGSSIQQSIQGDNNILTANLGTGANHTSVMNIVGDSNQVTHASTSVGTTSANISVAGNLNNIGVTQSGMTTQSVTVNATGNSNAISINQSN
jgi:hypothetical protein